MSDLGNKTIMAKNIKYYMELYNIDRNKLCADLNIKYTTLCDWLNAKTYPRIDKIELMANYFKIQKSDLVEESFQDKTVRLLTGVDSIIEDYDKNISEYTTPGMKFVKKDGSEYHFEVSSLIYTITESIMNMPSEKQEMIYDMVEGQSKRKKHIIYVENPQHAKIAGPKKKREPFTNYEDAVNYLKTMDMIAACDGKNLSEETIIQMANVILENQKD